MRRFNKVLLLAIIIIMAFIAACSSSDEQSTDEVGKSTDSAFIKDLENALDKRWDYSDEVESGEVEVIDPIEHMEKLLSFEKMEWEADYYIVDNE